MSQENRSYRIRTQVGNHESMIHVDMEQTIDTFEILSLKISQTSAYKLMNSDSGLIVGRVVANGGFGVPNAKVSVFVPYENTEDMKKRLMYYYTSPRDTNTQGIRYNLLPEQLDDVCHQSVGTFPDKRVLLDNDSWIEIFDKYYKYTTRTNNSGDYMIYGAPIGTQTIHVDVDLSDIGVLSQRPRDMVYKGANINQFESPNKFRVDTNLASLAQIFTEDKTIYVYPFWGDTTDSDTGAAVTRCDINLSYKFEPTCIFMGSIITDTGENSLSKKCVAHKNQGKMSDMITGQGTIEMIRKTPDNKIEQYSVQGNQLIDGDGVWCYQIPMNLDYVITDEFGNTVLTDDPNKGIATRARVRFRIGMTETGTEETARKRARFLVPNNPRLVEDDYPYFTKTKEVDYEFGSKTKDENFRDLLWNKVYTVKSYIPRLQKSVQPQNKKYLGIKMVNHSGGNNPMPFNNLSIKFNFTYMFLCALLKVLVTVVRLTNQLICGIGNIFFSLFMFCTTIANKIDWKWTYKVFYGFDNTDEDNWGRGDFVTCTYLEWLGKSTPDTTRGLGKWFLQGAFEIGCGIVLEGLCEDENGESKSYSPGSGKLIDNLNTELKRDDHKLEYTPEQTQLRKTGFSCSSDVAELYNCIENQLAQDNEVTSFNFVNDWVNGVLYMPLWFRKIKPKRRFLFFNLKAKDQWCSSDKRNGQGIFQRDLKLYRTCAQQIQQKSDYVLQPLVNDYNTINYKKSEANPNTGKDEIVFRNYNDINCYGYQCHTQARTYLPIDYGIITEKETIYGEHVYYYRPVDYNTKYNTDLVTLYATDIILLGSLSSCDIHGIPQFFKALSSTTYNMPSDLLVEDFTYNSETETNESVDEKDENYTVSIDKEGYKNQMTEITGSDWGNLGVDQSGSGVEKSTNLYDNGGLFYGITCFDSYTKPKSCINLSRICEFGISLDESQDILEIGEAEKVNTEDEIYNLYETLIPDGYVSYDEIYDMDYRSIFATLNGNWLKTKVNDNTGLTEYDFNRLYVENFDGLLSDIMKSYVTQAVTELTNTKANYSGNYNLERNSIDYIKFRFGEYIKQNGENMYFYDYNKTIGGFNNYRVNTKRRFPRYENSFYFYFGLNEGKTAIDKFRTNYFAECTNDTKGELAYDITFVPNPWCGEESGYINFNTNLPTPISIELIDKDNPNNKYIANNINNEKFYIGKEQTNNSGFKYIELLGNNSPISSLPTGEYKLTLIDGEEEEYHDTIIFKDETISYNINTQAFVYNANELESKYLVVDENTGEINWKQTFTDIAEDSNIIRLSNKRVIGGTIIIENISVNDFKLSITPVNKEFFGYTEEETDYPGIDIIMSKQMTDNSVSYKIIDRDGVGYVNTTTAESSVILGDTIIIGVPYCDQKYKVQITQLCDLYKSENTLNVDADGNLLCTESDNSLINTVTVYSRVFTMYINGIDYDLIRNFKTGWVEGTIGDMSKYEYTTSDVFKATNIYGWDDLDNIGKFVLKNGDVKSINDYFDGDSLKNYRDNNQNGITDNELRSIGNILSTNFEGNGKKIYTEKRIINDDNTSRIERIDYSTPYSWSTSYCYDADEWENDKNSLTTAIIDKMDEILRNRIEFTKQVKGAFCYEQDGKTLTVTYKSTATPIDYRCVGNQFGVNNEINKINPGETSGGSMSVVTVDITKMVGDFQIIGDVTTNEVISNMATLTYVDPVIDDNGNIITNGEYKNYNKFNNKNNKQAKLPYYFTIIDNNGNTLPSKSNNISGGIQVENTDNTKLDVSKMFGVHIYDKPMYFDIVRYWTGFNNYNYKGNFVNLPGFLRGDVINGIENPQVNISNQSNVLYNVIDNQYTNTNVRRYIYTDNSQSENLYYGKYINDSNSSNDYQYIEIDNKNNRTVIVSDGYCTDYEAELGFNFSVNINDSYFTYRTNGILYLDYINLTVNNAPSNNITHYLFEYVGDNNGNGNYVYDNLDDNITKWNDMPQFFLYENYTDINLGLNYKISTTSNRITIPKVYDDKFQILSPKQISKQYFVLSVCNNKYYTLSPVIDYTPIRCFALWYEKAERNEENKLVKKNQNKTTIYLSCQINDGEDKWSDYNNIQYLKVGNNITIKIPQYNDDLVNQIDFEYSDIFTKNISIDTAKEVTIKIQDIEKNSEEIEEVVTKREALRVIKIEFSDELEIADWHMINVIDCVGIRRQCIMDINSIITEPPIQQTPNE